MNTVRPPRLPEIKLQAARSSVPLHRQQGAALLVSLLMLVAILLLGISAVQIALQGEKSSRNDRDRQIAFQAAEAGLMDAEMDIENSIGTNSRSHIFSRKSTEGFTEGCGAGSNNIYLGLCNRADTGATPVWQTLNFLDESGAANTVPYGHFTGQVFDTGKGKGSLPSRPPRYIIEVMVYNKPGEAASQDDVTYFYRITAIGFGTQPGTQVALQTFYRKDGI